MFLFLVFSVNIGNGEGWKLASTLDCIIEKIMGKMESYKIQISKVIFKRGAECILKNSFSATECVITCQKLRRKIFSFRYRPKTSENMCKISIRSNKKLIS